MAEANIVRGDEAERFMLDALEGKAVNSGLDIGLMFSSPQTELRQSKLKPMETLGSWIK